MKYLLTFLFLTTPLVAVAKVILNCESTRYDISTPYTVKWGKGWVPKKHKHVISQNKASYYFGDRLIQEGKLISDNNDRIKIRYRFIHKSQTYTDINFLYFKKKKKFSVDWSLPGGYATPGDVWGTCVEESNYSKADKKADVQNDKSNTILSEKINYAEDKCKDLGFQKGTVKFGDCVLKLME